MKSSDINLEVNPELARKILTEFIHSEITRAGFERAVVGVSGGIDSALACILSAKALGPANVLAVRMPYSSSSPESLEHAALLIEMTGVQSKTIEITEAVDGLLEALSREAVTMEDDNHAISGHGRIRRGNVMARMRMTVLYDLSAEFEGLVVGTGNKTEILLGYTTQFGDAASALNPLGDLYKTQLRQLARSVGVPEVILEMPPTADLWKGQTDEGELGFSYEDVDRLLFLMVDRRYSPEACVEAGFEQDFVERIVRLVRRNQFKRVMPPIAKLSNRTVGYDFLYLRDWGT